jgi:anhydro-N-acetylmuramic acid kinase
LLHHTKKGKLLVTGGGAYNDFLIERFKNNYHRNGNNPNYKHVKEALIFGLLGVEITRRNQC